MPIHLCTRIRIDLSFDIDLLKESSRVDVQNATILLYSTSYNHSKKKSIQWNCQNLIMERHRLIQEACSLEVQKWRKNKHQGQIVLPCSLSLLLQRTVQVNVPQRSIQWRGVQMQNIVLVRIADKRYFEGFKSWAMCNCWGTNSQQVQAYNAELTNLLLYFAIETKSIWVKYRMKHYLQ